ncbi:hypothetical protein [Bradyrhizobium sp.]
MLNRLKAYWPAAILVLLIMAVIDGTLSSLLTCHPVSAQTSGSADHQQTKEQCTALGGPILISLRWIAGVTHKYEGLITAAFTVVLAIFTGRLWYSTDKLWGATTDLVKGAEDTAQRQLRAYVYVDPGNGEIRIGLPISIAMLVKNAGQTPAHETRVWTKVEVIDFPLRENLKIELPDDAVPKLVIHPGTFAYGIQIQRDAPLTATEGAALRADSKRVFLWGVIFYKDVFNRDRETHFRLSFGGEAFAMKKLQWCEDGNTAT